MLHFLHEWKGIGRGQPYLWFLSSPSCVRGRGAQKGEENSRNAKGIVESKGCSIYRRGRRGSLLRERDWKEVVLLQLCACIHAIDDVRNNGN